MSSKVRQYLNLIAKMGKLSIIEEARKLGVRIKHKSSKEEALRVLLEMQHRVIEDYLSKEEKEEREGKVFEAEQRQMQRVKPVISEQLQRLRVRMMQIDRIHLNQYSQRYYQSQGRTAADSDDYKGNALDGLMGIRTQIYLNPKEIKHEHQYPFDQLQREVFPTITQEQGVKDSKAKIIAKFFDPSLSLRDNLLLSYGLKKEKEFNASPQDSLQSLLFCKHTYFHIATIPNMLTSIHRYGAYYAETMSGLQASSLAKFIKNFSDNLDKLNPRMGSRNYFSLTIAEGMLRSSGLIQAIEKGSDQGKYVISWIYIELRAFIGNIQVPDYAKELDQTFLKTLKKYNLIKLHLLSSPFSADVPQDVLIGTENKQWPEKMLVKLEESVEEVGVGDFGGRRVVDRLTQIRQVIEFISDEGLQLGSSFLEKLLLSVRSGLDWMQHEKEREAEIQDQALAWQLQSFYNLDFCKAIVKAMFLSVQTKEDRSILDFIWGKFLPLTQVNESIIQHLFLLINTTIRSRLQSLLQGRREKLYYILQCSIESIFVNDLASMKSEKVMNFIRAEGTVLLEPEQKEVILSHLQLRLQQGNSDRVI